MVKPSKQSFLPLLILVVAISVILGAAFLTRSNDNPAPASASTDDWPTYMFDGARSGFNKNEVHLSPDNASNLKLLWKQHLGNILAAQPIVKGDIVYEGSWDGLLYALNTQTGA